jgi:GT2 family glycosyltransferase
MQKKISIQIVTFNSGGQIEKCLESLQKNSPDSEVIIVDNNSTDDTLEKVKKSKIKIINESGNLGFGKAHNLAAIRAEGEYLVILNPDTILQTKNGFEKITEILENNKDFGLIAPKLIYPDGKTQKSVRNLPTFWGACREYLFGQKGAYDFYELKSNGLCGVEAVVGACMVIKKDLFLKIGGFSEKYFMYFEDLDLCRNLKANNLKVVYYPEVIVEHIVGASGEGDKTNVQFYKSFQKYHGFIEATFLNLLFLLIRIRNKIGKIKE